MTCLFFLPRKVIVNEWNHPGVWIERMGMFYPNTNDDEMLMIFGNKISKIFHDKKYLISLPFEWIPQQLKFLKNQMK